VIIVGGGIGGLSTAIALRRHGHDVVVLERAPHLEPVGAGITLFANAMDALGQLGVAKGVAAAGSPVVSMTFHTSDGQQLTHLPSDLVAGAIAIHRGELQTALQEAAGEIRLAAEIESIHQTADAVVARATDGGEERGDLLIGASVRAGRAVLARRSFRIIARAVALTVVVVAAARSRSVAAHLGHLGHPSPVCLAAAIGAEIVSLLAYTLMARELRRLGGGAARARSLLRPMLGGIAMLASLPGGVGASNVYWYKQLRHHGADRRLTTLVMTGSTIASAISLCVLLAAGVAIAGNSGPLPHAHTWLLGVATVTLAARLLFRHHLGRWLTRVLQWIDPAVEPTRSLRVRRLRAIILLAHANWLFDCAALYAALLSVHAAVPARGVILVYVLAQLVASVGLVPGGGGTVELSLVVGFATFGHQAGGTLFAGVLLYRILSCWGLIPIGWLAVLLDPPGVRNQPAAFSEVADRPTTA
jgi:putative heme transporter